MIVMKFGGTSVGNALRIREVVGIVKSQLGNGPIVVVSALGGITDALIETGKQAAAGKDVNVMLDQIVKRHYDTIAELKLERKIIAPEVEQLGKLLGEIFMLGELNPRNLDKLMSFGERMSARIVAACMRSAGLDGQAYDSYDIGMITTSNFGDADITPYTYQRIKKALSGKSCIPVITGFLGKSKEGEITTLGRGGSDYTASIVGAAVGAKEIQIWTDVNGIMTADPKIVKSARSIDEVSYKEATELALLGAKVLHPKTILPAVENSIPVRILNTFNPSHKGTLVLSSVGAGSRITSITYKKHIMAISISSIGKVDSREFLRKVLEIFDRNGVPVDLVSNSKIGVSVTIDERNESLKLMTELQAVGKVEAKSNRARVSLVGNDLLYMPDILQNMYTSLKSIEIEMVSSRVSRKTKSVVIAEKYADRAVKRLHTTFFSR